MTTPTEPQEREQEQEQEQEQEYSARDGLPEVSCATCSEVRNLLDFYDGEHKVNLMIDPWEIVVDHGELLLAKDKASL